MSTKFLIAAAAAFLVATPALAATQAASKGHANSTSASLKTGAHHRHRIARKVSMRGDTEVHALNALEAAGYRRFDDLHANGKDFVATASKAGKSYDVTVMPSGSIKATIA